MTIKNVYYSSHFRKSLKKHRASRRTITAKIELFLQEPFHPSLKTHKLSGKLEGFWSFSISYHLRLLFEFIDEESVGLVDVGTHGIYRF